MQLDASLDGLVERIGFGGCSPESAVNARDQPFAALLVGFQAAFLSHGPSLDF
jgi:hypothetical protein